MRYAMLLVLLTLSAVSCFAEASPGIETASVTELSRAMGHYARARALLIKAIQEFDLANATANPDVILDATAWRNEVISRARDLEKVLDPQPRISKEGVKYEADSRLLGEAKVK